MLNSAAEGILGLDVHGKIIFANPSASEMVEWETEDLIGKSIHEIIHNLDPEGKPYKEINAFQDTIKNKSTHFRNDEYFWNHYTAEISQAMRKRSSKTSIRGSCRRKSLYPDFWAKRAGRRHQRRYKCNQDFR